MSQLLQGNDSHRHQPVATRQTTCATCHNRGQFCAARAGILSQHSGTSALDGGPDRDGVGRKVIECGRSRPPLRYSL